MAMPETTWTLAAPFALTGRGLHGNKPCSVTVSPAECGGLRFIHAPSGTHIPATEGFVGDLSLATTLVKGDARLQTVEHVLSALYGLGVAHALIEVDGEELPILDGSSAPWAEAVGRVGLRALGVAPRRLKVLRKVSVRDGQRHISISPSDRLRLSYSIDFPGTSIGRQSLSLNVTPESYRRELASARAFCLKREIDYMRSRGLALGGSLDNAVVYDENGHMNGSLRFKDEAVRHKLLDLVGDLALIGMPLLGHVEAHAAGHALHVSLAKRLLDDVGAWTVDGVPPARAPQVYGPDLVHGLAAV